MQLRDFLGQNESEIISFTETKTLDLAGGGPTSSQLKEGLPVFMEQLLKALKFEETEHPNLPPDKAGMARAARAGDEPAMASAAGHPEEVELAESAGRHGVEYVRLGYTLSHVVHAYGAMCQAVTDLASSKKVPISAEDFHVLNRCLDVAIAGAVTAFECEQNARRAKAEGDQAGALAAEMRNALDSVKVSFRMVKDGKVGLGGSTGRVLEDGLNRLGTLIERAAEARS